MSIEKYLQVETLSLVLIGDFNPIIFQPFWLSSKELIREEEATSAKVDIIHSEFVKYELDWISIEITKNRCEFTSSKVPFFEPLKDLVIEIFSILRETPLKSYGLNYIYDLSLQTQKKYYNLGAQLTPLDFWQNKLTDPKLQQIEIIEEKRNDEQIGSRRIRISPSSITTLSYGVAFNINNHFEIKNSSMFKKSIEENWKISKIQSFELLENLFDKISI